MQMACTLPSSHPMLILLFVLLGVSRLAMLVSTAHRPLIRTSCLSVDTRDLGLEDRRARMLYCHGWRRSQCTSGRSLHRNRLKACSIEKRWVSSGSPLLSSLVFSSSFHNPFCLYSFSRVLQSSIGSSHGRGRCRRLIATNGMVKSGEA